MFIHAITDLCKPYKMYMLNDPDKQLVHFIDLDHITQTMLVRLPPLYVCDQSNVDNFMDFYLPLNHEVLTTFNTLENNARSFVGMNNDESTINDVLHTFFSADLKIFNPDNTLFSEESVLNSFVEPILAIYGFSYTNDKISFIYKCVQVKRHSLKAPILNIPDDVNLFQL